MGDHRASIEIKFSMYGETEEADMWINWSPDSECQDIDQRVIDFFRDAYLKMRSAYDAECIELNWAREKREQEAQERREYERLKAKFGEQA